MPFVVGAQIEKFTWNTVMMAHSKESKFFLQHLWPPSGSTSQNLQPNRFIP